jgi:hypothetical protein
MINPQLSTAQTLETQSQLEHGFVAESFSNGTDLSRRVARTLRQALVKIDFADILFFLFVLTLVRQFSWGLEHQVLAWTLTALVSGFICGAHIWARDTSHPQQHISFWLIVGLTLLFVYLLNMPSPDDSFDVLNYHLVNGERALRGWPFISGDFFPTIIQVNPAPDMVNALFRHALGYRLGTIVNLLALLWIAMIVDRFLRPYLRNHWLRASCTLLVISTEFLLYLLDFYLIDLLSLPLLLEATFLTLNFEDIRKKNYALVHIGLFLGISTAFKLTNLAFVIPIVICCALKAFSHRKDLRFAYVVVAAVVCVAPLIPFSLFLYRQTGSALFPFYNGIFKSPFVGLRNYDDHLHGPKTWWEIILWPIMIVIYPERLSEMSGLVTGYTGRISIAYVVSILGLATRTLDKKLRTICLVTLISTVLWSITNGNGRYGLYLELIGGIAAIGLLATVYRSQLVRSEDGGNPHKLKTLISVALFGLLLLIQSAVAYHHVYYYMFLRTSQGGVKLGVLAEFRASLFEVHNILHDRSAVSYLPKEQQEKLSEVDVWVNSCYTTNGIEVLLKPEIPIVSVSDYLRVFDLLETKESQQRLAQTLASLHGKRMFTLVRDEHLHEARKDMERVGLKMGNSTRFNLPFFSECIFQPMFLIEVKPIEPGNSDPGPKK